MTCRHRPGDPTCTAGNSPKALYERGKQAIKDGKALMSKWGSTPDNGDYDVIQAEEVGCCMVLLVEYPSCDDCTYEGKKVMVFLGVTPLDVIRWKKIDPHFRSDAPSSAREAPSPAARFPATDQGWKDAMEFAKRKSYEMVPNPEENSEDIPF